MIYIVRKPFKSKGVFYPVATIVEDDDSIKRFKQKVYDKRIIRATEETLPDWEEYFKTKFGKDISGPGENGTAEDKNYTTEMLAYITSMTDATNISTVRESIESRYASDKPAEKISKESYDKLVAALSAKEFELLKPTAAAEKQYVDDMQALIDASTKAEDVQEILTRNETALAALPVPGGYTKATYNKVVTAAKAKLKELEAK